MDNNEGASLVPIQKVRARYGDVSAMWVERRLRDESGFPKPHYIGRLRFWRLSDLIAWERALPQTRLDKPKAQVRPAEKDA